MITTLKTGDLIGFSAYSSLGILINLGTYGIPFWDLSHIAIVGEFQGSKVLFESTTLNDVECLVQGKRVSGVQATSIVDRLDGYNGKVWHYPLSEPLTAPQRKTLNRFLLGYIGTEYDAIGAFRSAGVGWSWIESKLRRADLNSLFCSEYCAAAHNAIGVLDVQNVSRWSPNALVRRERRDGIIKEPSRWV